MCKRLHMREVPDTKKWSNKKDLKFSINAVKSLVQTKKLLIVQKEFKEVFRNR